MLQWRVVFQCKFVILNNLFLSPPNIWQRLAVFLIIVTSMQNIFSEHNCRACRLSWTFHVIWNTWTASYKFHVWLWVLDSFWQRTDYQDDVTCLVQLSIRFRRLNAFAACSVYNASISSKAITAVYFGRDLAELEVLRVTQTGDQLLRLRCTGCIPQSCSSPLRTSHGSGDSRTVESVVLRLR